MHGWPAVYTLAAAEIVLLIALNRGVFRRWWYAPLTIVIAAVLFKPLDNAFFGDISRVLPRWMFSDGSDGKDQIIIASTISAILAPLILASAPISILRALLGRKSSR